MKNNKDKFSNSIAKTLDSYKKFKKTIDESKVNIDNINTEQEFKKALDTTDEYVYRMLKNNLKKISDELPLLDVKDGVIKLDKNNPDHVDWYEDDCKFKELYEKGKEYQCFEENK